MALHEDITVSKVTTKKAHSKGLIARQCKLSTKIVENVSILSIFNAHRWFLTPATWRRWVQMIDLH